MLCRLAWPTQRGSFSRGASSCRDRSAQASDWACRLAGVLRGHAGRGADGARQVCLGGKRRVHIRDGGPRQPSRSAARVVPRSPAPRLANTAACFSWSRSRRRSAACRSSAPIPIFQKMIPHGMNDAIMFWNMWCASCSVAAIIGRMLSARCTSIRTIRSCFP